jgi:hypothetical protein
LRSEENLKRSEEGQDLRIKNRINRIIGLRSEEIQKRSEEAAGLQDFEQDLQDKFKQKLSSGISCIPIF